MKPIVIYLEKNKDEIKLTKAEFEEYINNAYNTGYNCGYAEGKKTLPWWNWNYSTTVPQPITTIHNTPITNPDYITVTCEAHNSIGD